MKPETSRWTNDRQHGYVLDASDGENLIHFRDGGLISIKVGSSTSSDRLAVATQQVMKGSGIPTHRHLDMDEAFYVLEGRGVFFLDDERHPFEKGATIFVPRNTWHSFENADEELLLLWVVAPALLDSFFRETCNAVGEASKNLNAETVRAIALQYGTEFR